jgi:hypothetical protein
MYLRLRPNDYVVTCNDVLLSVTISDQTYNVTTKDFCFWGGQVSGFPASKCSTEAMNVK